MKGEELFSNWETCFFKNIKKKFFRTIHDYLRRYTTFTYIHKIHGNNISMNIKFSPRKYLFIT